MKRKKLDWVGHAQRKQVSVVKKVLLENPRCKKPIGRCSMTLDSVLRTGAKEFQISGRYQTMEKNGRKNMFSRMVSKSLNPPRKKKFFSLQIHLSAQRLQANHHRVQILTFPQIHRLKCLLGRHAHGYGHGQKVIDIFHTLKSHGAGVHFLDGSRNQSVYQSVQNKIVILNTQQCTIHRYVNNLN